MDKRTLIEIATNALMNMQKRCSELYKSQDVSDWTIGSRNEGLLHYDFTDGRLARRKRSIIKYYEIANQRFGKYYKNRERLFDSFVHSNILIGKGGYNYTDRLHYISTLAAIWILDQLKQQDDIEKIYDCIPEDILSGLSWNALPLVNYSNFSSDLIKQVTALIIRRNEGLFDKHGEDNTSLLDEWGINLNRVVTEKAKYRNSFEKMMQLIDARAITNVVSAFQSKLWQAYDIAYMAESTYENKKHVLELEINQLEKEKKQYKAKCNVNKKNNVVQGPWAAPKKTEKDEEFFGLFDLFDQDETLREINTKINLNSMQIEMLGRQQGSIFTDLMLPNDREKRIEVMKDILTEEQYEYMLNYRLEEPYSYAFALLYLLDTNSDLPWLYYGGLTVMYQIEDISPFNTSFNYSSERGKNADSINKYLYEPMFPGNHYAGEMDGDGDPVNRRKCSNLAQKIYAQTLSIIPRYSTFENFDLSMFQGAEQTSLFSILLSLGKETGDTIVDAQWFRLLNKDEEEEANKQQEVVIDNSECIAELNREIKSLRRQLYDDRVKYKKLKAEYDDSQSIQENQRHELSDLRNIVFNQGKIEDEQSEVSATTKFPYNTALRTISFGGHESWLKTMKLMLPDVRFIKPDMLPNTDLIKNADVIWIQPNCLSHSDFYKIINVIRENDIPIRYYCFNSPLKCAEQLVENEMNNK